MSRDRAGAALVANSGWRVAIVDDEAPAIKRLSALVNETDDFTVVATYTDPVDALAAIRAMQGDIELDVLFLDVRMPGLTGLELARALGEAAPLVVFVTAFDEHAVRAFEFNAADYVLKPVERSRFARTMDRLRQRLTSSRETSTLPSQLEAVLRSLRHLPTASAAPVLRMALRTRERTTLIDPLHIDRVDADGNTLHIQARRDRYAVRETLTSFAERLPAACFLRVNRSTLVRIDHVRHVEPWINGDYTLVLADGQKVTSGRTYRDGVRAALALS